MIESYYRVLLIKQCNLVTLTRKLNDYFTLLMHYLQKIEAFRAKNILEKKLEIFKRSSKLYHRIKDHLESFTVKPDLTRAWYDSDQIGYNWADRRNDDVIANSGKGLNFLVFDNLSRQRISPLIQSEQQQTVQLQVLNENKFK
ncbi:unnamed protein product [Brachionus calyciflorus]|uniref:Uncharacterized protein n=1 Tax=Brachionus calyciflorus TaxID=104777 RepID=A0A814JMB1_9BILA|nr:unnamed protein product [Brachionus calyciflorus]